MLLVLWVIGVMIGAPLLVGAACHVALVRPSIGAAIAVGLCVYASHRADHGVVVAGIELCFLGKLFAGALAVAGGFVAMAALVGTCQQRRESSTIATARIARG